MGERRHPSAEQGDESRCRLKAAFRSTRSGANFIITAIFSDILQTAEAGCSSEVFVKAISGRP
jgi:hypothetical protein